VNAVDGELVVENQQEEQSEHERRHRVEEQGQPGEGAVRDDLDLTADSTPLSTPSTTQMMAAPMTRDTVIGTADFSTEFTDWPW